MFDRNIQKSSSTYEEARKIEDKIQNAGFKRREQINQLIDEMLDEYKELHKETSEFLHTRINRWDTLDVVVRLSQYGVGLHKIGTAYSNGINSIACNKPE